MIGEIVGFVHLCHCPLLLCVPFVFDTFYSHICYLQYFFIIMSSYTFTEGECPISYGYKKWIDPTYIAGKNIYHYPEMERILPSYAIAPYFCVTTIGYFGILSGIVIYYHLQKHVWIPSLCLVIYFSFVHNIIQKDPLFLFQEIAKGVFILAIFQLELLKISN